MRPGGPTLRTRQNAQDLALVAGAGGRAGHVAFGDLVPDGKPVAGVFASVSAGYHTTCGLRTNGTVTCWGDNSSGEDTPPAR
jgi:hypothetical protein